MTVARFERSQLGALTKISEGGQGVVFEAPRLRVNGVGEAVYKEYKPEALAQVDARQLEAMVGFLAKLPPDRAARLIELTAWPLALICDRGRVTGFAMPRVPNEFFVELQLPGGLKLALGQFQHLFNREDWLAQRGIQIHDRLRLELLADVARALDFLHGHGVAVGDFSAKNLLFSLDPTPRCYFIDCDAMSLGGKSVMKQFETPDWDVHAVSKEQLATPASDAYKLGLLAVRLFAMDQITRGESSAASIPSSIGKVARRALDVKPSRRPPPSAWLSPINGAMAAASTTLPQRGGPIATITVVPQAAAAALLAPGQQAPVTQPAGAGVGGVALPSAAFPGLTTMPTPITPPAGSPPPTPFAPAVPAARAAAMISAVPTLGGAAGAASGAIPGPARFRRRPKSPMPPTAPSAPKPPRLAGLRAGPVGRSTRAVATTAGAVGSVAHESLAVLLRWLTVMVPASVVASLWAALSFERAGDYPPYGRALRHLLGITLTLAGAVFGASLLFAAARRATGRRPAIFRLPRWQATTIALAGLAGLVCFFLGAYVDVPLFGWHQQPEIGPDPISWWGTPVLMVGTFVVTLPFRFREP